MLESVENARSDFQARRFIELKNKADADLRHTDKGLSAPGTTITAEERRRIETAAAKTHEAMQGDNGDVLHAALDELNRTTLPLAERLMNAVVRTTLKDRQMGEVDAKKL